MSNNLREQRMRAREAAITALKQNNRASYDLAMADVEKLSDEIKKSETRSSVDFSSGNYVSSDKNRTFAFAKWLRNMQLNDAERRSVESRDGQVEGAPMLNHIGTYTGLGFFVPTGFADQIEQATKYFAPLLDVFGRVDTATGNPLPYPTANDTGTEATIVGEGSLNSESDGLNGNLGASSVNFAAYKFSSGFIKASLELMQDSAFDLESYLAERFGERFGRAYENKLTNGSGSSEPTGIITAVLTSGVTPVIAAGSSESTGGSQTGANSIGYSDLINLEHSVDPTYRRGAKYMFHDQTLSALKRILDKFGRPLWTPGISVSEPSTINGYQYVINQHMPQITVASGNTVLFGDLKKFMIRKVKDMSIQKLVERYAENGQVAFLAHSRIDSNLLDAGTHPISLLQQHS